MVEIGAQPTLRVVFRLGTRARAKQSRSRQHACYWFSRFSVFVVGLHMCDNVQIFRSMGLHPSAFDQPAWLDRVAVASWGNDRGAVGLYVMLLKFRSVSILSECSGFCWAWYVWVRHRPRSHPCWPRPVYLTGPQRGGPIGVDWHGPWLVWSRGFMWVNLECNRVVLYEAYGWTKTDSYVCIASRWPSRSFLPSEVHQVWYQTQSSQPKWHIWSILSWAFKLETWMW